jgi:hypothetical protein
MRDTKDTINSYITDMLSLEEHLDKAITGQIEDLKDDPQVVADLKAIQRWVQHHVSDLKQRSEARQAATPTDAVKRAGSGVLGFVAGLIDLVRSEGLAKPRGSIRARRRRSRASLPAGDGPQLPVSAGRRHVDEVYHNLYSVRRARMLQRPILPFPCLICGQPPHAAVQRCDV